MTMNSESLTPQPAFRWSRRGLMRRLGLAGLGGVAARAATAGASPPASPAPESSTSASNPPTTSILEAGGSRVLLRTGPLRAFAVPRGARIGVCLLAGGEAGGENSMIRSIVAARSDHHGLSSFLADPRVEQGVHRLLGALDTVEPVELHGLSARVADDISAGDPFEITWEANLAPGAGGPGSIESLRAQLERYHACVFGELSPESAFTAHLNYIEVSRA